eukprot:6616571-Prymnesium_polylepis.1
MSELEASLSRDKNLYLAAFENLRNRAGRPQARSRATSGSLGARFMRTVGLNFGRDRNPSDAGLPVVDLAVLKQLGLILSLQRKFRVRRQLYAT